MTDASQTPSEDIWAEDRARMQQEQERFRSEAVQQPESFANEGIVQSGHAQALDDSGTKQRQGGTLVNVEIFSTDDGNLYTGQANISNLALVSP